MPFILAPITLVVTTGHTQNTHTYTHAPNCKLLKTGTGYYWSFNPNNNKANVHFPSCLLTLSLPLLKYSFPIHYLLIFLLSSQSSHLQSSHPDPETRLEPSQLYTHKTMYLFPLGTHCGFYVTFIYVVWLSVSPTVL